MNNVIVIIDDGINKKRINKDSLEFELKVSDNLLLIDASKQSSKGIHGSICYSIMQSIYPSIRIGSIKIFEDEMDANVGKLEAALEWCFTKQIKVIHLSIGSVDMNDYFVLEPIVKKLIRNNSIIIAAMDNANRYTIPACFGGVIGVSHINHRDYFSNVRNLLNHPKVYSTALTEWIPKYQSSSSNSFAAPMVTAAVAQYLDYNGENCKVKQVLNYLKCEFMVNNLACFRPDFLTTPIVLKLNTADRLTVEFGYEEVVISHNLLLKLSETIVILEECLNDRENLYSFLRANKDKITGIIYTGMRDISLYHLIESEIMCLYYDESSISSYLNDVKIDDDIDSDIPVILFLMDHAEFRNGIHIGGKLQQFFHEQGYAMQLISTLKYSYLYGCDYCQDYMQVRTLLSDEYQISQYDLRMVITDNNQIAQDKYIDVCIGLGDVWRKKSNNIYLLPISCDDTCFSNLTDFLIECLV